MGRKINLWNIQATNLQEGTSEDQDMATKGKPHKRNSNIK